MSGQKRLVRLFLGIDGGGTHTRAVLIDSCGIIQGRGQAGPSNYHNVGLPVAAANLRRAAEDAWRAAGQEFQAAESCFLGLAGTKAAVDFARLQSTAEGIGLAQSGTVEVANDLANALAGGLAGEPGIALVAGTGSNCLGRDSAGALRAVGGWGWLLDDKGGAIGLALDAMRAAVRSADGLAPKTQLLPAIMAFLGLTEPGEISARLYAQTWTPGDLAGFAPVVTRLAAENDKVALEILRDGAATLASLVAGCADLLDFPGGPKVVILGSCARSVPLYTRMIEAAIRKAAPVAQICEPRFSSVQGAALNALRLGGISLLPAISAFEKESVFPEPT